MSTAIKVENLGKKYIIGHQKQEKYTALRDVISNKIKSIVKKGESQTKEEFWALKDLSFEIKQGDRVGIIGHNGAGKSTLLKILSRITEPTTGKVSLNGRVASLLEVGTGFHPELTGRENIYLNGAILGMSKAEIKKKFDEIADFAEVEKFLDTPVKRYSSGMYVRLAFAVAAHLEPEILVVDEVLAVGDAQFQKKCLGKMEDVGREGRTVLFVSHNMGAISTLCNKSILLVGGELHNYDSTSKIVALYNNIGFLQATIDIKASMRKRGNGLIEFIRCTLMDNKNETKNSFYILEEIKFNMLLNSKLRGKVSFWLIIYDSLGKPLVSSFQKDYELVDVIQSKYLLTFRTVGNNLLPGHYSVGVGAFDDKMNFLEWVDGCQSFEVMGRFLNEEPFDERLGQVNQKVDWMLLPE